MRNAPDQFILDGMQSMAFVSLALFPLGLGCMRQISVENVENVIETCKSDVDVVRKEFGDPDEIGKIGDLITNEYRRMGKKLIVAYDSNDIVVDVAVNPSGLIELKNRCRKR